VILLNEVSFEKIMYYFYRARGYNTLLTNSLFMDFLREKVLPSRNDFWWESGFISAIESFLASVPSGTEDFEHLRHLLDVSNLPLVEKPLSKAATSACQVVSITAAVLV
jgi:hypothetical protein